MLARLLPVAEAELDEAEHVLDVAEDDVRLVRFEQLQRALGGLRAPRRGRPSRDTATPMRFSSSATSIVIAEASRKCSIAF